MKRINPAYALALIALTFTVAVQCAEERMRAGLWEVITTVDGKPSGVTGGTCYSATMVQSANMPANLLREAYREVHDQTRLYAPGV